MVLILIEVGIILFILFIIGFGLTKWLSDRSEPSKVELQPPFQKDKKKKSKKKE